MSQLQAMLNKENWIRSQLYRDVATYVETQQDVPPDFEAVWLYPNGCGHLYIIEHTDGKYSTIASQDSAYGTFDECAVLLEQHFGEPEPVEIKGNFMCIWVYGGSPMDKVSFVDGSYFKEDIGFGIDDMQSIQDLQVGGKPLLLEGGELSIARIPDQFQLNYSSTLTWLLIKTT